MLGAWREGAYYDDNKRFQNNVFVYLPSRFYVTYYEKMIIYQNLLSLDQQLKLVHKRRAGQKNFQSKL